MKVLLSIKPVYVEKIFSGEKRFEYRKSIFKRKDVDTIVVYSTKPVGKIVGEFKIKCIHKNSPNAIWNKTKSYSGISEKFFFQYFKEKELAYAIEIEDVIKYTTEQNPYTVFSKFTPPQSFIYIEDKKL